MAYSENLLRPLFNLPDLTESIDYHCMSMQIVMSVCRMSVSSVFCFSYLSKCKFTKIYRHETYVTQHIHRLSAAKIPYW